MWRENRIYVNRQDTGEKTIYNNEVKKRLDMLGPLTIENKVNIQKRLIRAWRKFNK